MISNQEELQKLIKEKGIRTIASLNFFMNELTNEAVETLYEKKIIDHIGHSKNQKKADIFNKIKNGYSSKQ